jgi:large subunit ribosomal protein L4
VATLKKYDLKGKELGAVSIDDALLEVSAHSQSIKDYIVAIRNNARQWSANTRRRDDSHHTGRKPHPQKGQGRSRQGDLAAPHYKGGAVVWGPRPKFDVHTRINQKERRAAIRFLLAEKIKAGHVHVLGKAVMKAPKTKHMAEFLDGLKIGDRRVLMLGDSLAEKAAGSENLFKSLRNIPKKEFLPFKQVNGYEVVRCQHIVVLESAVEELISLLG